MYGAEYTVLPQGRANLLLRSCTARDSHMAEATSSTETIEVVFSAEQHRPAH